MIIAWISEDSFYWAQESITEREVPFLFPYMSLKYLFPPLLAQGRYISFIHLTNIFLRALPRCTGHLPCPCTDVFLTYLVYTTFHVISFGCPIPWGLESWLSLLAFLAPGRAQLWLEMSININSLTNISYIHTYDIHIRCIRVWSWGSNPNHFTPESMLLTLF